MYEEYIDSTKIIELTHDVSPYEVWGTNQIHHNTPAIPNYKIF